MYRSRRTVVRSAVAGVFILLAGCVGNTGQSGDDSASATADDTERTASPAAMTTARSAVTEPVPTDKTMTVEITRQTGSLTVTAVEANFAGNEQHRLGSETVTFENTGDQPLDASGYTVEYGPTGKSYTFPKPRSTPASGVPPGDTFTLYSNSEIVTIMLGEQYDFTARFDEPALSADGGTITVTDADGNVVLEATYNPAKERRSQTTTR